MNQLPDKVLLATDGSEDAALAARAASDICTKAGSELHLIHVWHTIPSTRFKSFIREQLQREGCRLLNEQTAKIEGAYGITCEAHLREGRPAEEIVDFAEEIGANLVVVGSRGLGPVGRFLLGSVAEGVVHNAPCPILLMRGGEDAWPPTQVVFADDGSVEAKGAGELAARIGRLSGARGIVVRAYPRLPEVDEEARSLNARLADDALRHEQRDLGGRADDLEKVLGSPPRTGW
jgi:nucleotide-binding universal stress UspA family protein